MVYCRGGQPVRDQKPHFLLCYRKEPHHTHTVATHEHHPISSSLTHIPLLSYIYIKYRTPTERNAKSHPDFECEQLVRNFANYTRINMVAYLRKIYMKLGKRLASCGLATPGTLIG